MTERSTIVCQACGRPIAGDGLDGTCAPCLLELVLKCEPLPETETSDDEPGMEGSPNGADAPNGRAPRPLIKLPGFHVFEEIARGGMGIVYRAEQLNPRRLVAVKMLLPHQTAQPGMVERFRIETRTSVALEHSAILPVFHVGDFQGIPYFAMKLASAGTLAERKNEFRGKWRAIADLMATLAEAVQFAHEHGILHRDLKPGNVLFDDSGRAYVSDFGLAKLADEQSDLTRSVDMLGTPLYVAPEIASGSARQATTGSDIYSLGAILYELLAGVPPFQAPGVASLLKKIAEEPAQAPRERQNEAAGSMPRDLEVICLKCLNKQASRRYGSARELAEDLRRWLEGMPILARPATVTERAMGWVRRNRSLAVMGLLLGTVVLTALLMLGSSNRRLKQTLTESLIAQARLERNSGRPGQRWQTLLVASNAARHLHAVPSMARQSNVVLLRSEVASALALPDLRPLQRWPVTISHFENEFSFNADLTTYITPTENSGFGVYLAGAQAEVHRHKAAVIAPAVELLLSPRTSHAVVRYQDGRAELCRLSAQHPVRVERQWDGGGRRQMVFRFSDDGVRLSSLAPASEWIEIMDAETGRVEQRIPGKDVACMTFDNDGNLLATAGRRLSVWHLASTNLVWSTPLTHEASAVAWSPDSEVLAVALDRRMPNDGSAIGSDPVLIFNAADGRERQVFWHSKSRVERLAFHPSGRWLAAAAWDDLRIGAVHEQALSITMEAAHRALGFSTDGGRLGYAPSKHELGLMDLLLPTALRPWQSVSPPTDESYMISLSGNGRWAVTATRERVQLWDVENRREIGWKALPGRASWVQTQFGANDECVLYSAETFGVRRLEVVRKDAGAEFGRDELLGQPTGEVVFGFANDGLSLVVGEYRRHSVNERAPPSVWLWPGGKRAERRLLAQDFPLVGYRTIPGSKWAVSTDLIAPDLWVWNSETGQRVRNLEIPLRTSSEPVANGKWLVTRTQEEYVVWEVDTWRPVSRWPARDDEKGGGTIKATPDSRMLVSRGPGGRLVLRELPSGEELLRLVSPAPLSAVSTAITPDSQRLIVLQKNGWVTEWDLSTIRRELARLNMDWQ